MASGIDDVTTTKNGFYCHKLCITAIKNYLHNKPKNRLKNMRDILIYGIVFLSGVLVGYVFHILQCNILKLDYRHKD